MPTDPAIIAGALLLEDLVGFAWLYEARVPTTPATRIRITSYSTILNFGTYGPGATNPGDPIPYYPASVKHAPIRENADGDLPKLRVTVGNGRRLASDILRVHNGLKGMDARILLVRLDSLDDPAAAMRFHFEVERSGAEESVVALDLGQSHLQRAQDPPFRFESNGCVHLHTSGFGGAACGYPIPPSPTETVGGGFSTCPGPFGACTIRGDDEEARGLPRLHPERWGGKKGISRS